MGLFPPDLIAAGCESTSVAGTWVLQSTNAASGNHGPSTDPFLGSPGSGSAFTSVMTLAPNGEAYFEELFVQGYRAEGLEPSVSNSNQWALGADCFLEVSGSVSTNHGDYPQKFRVSVSENGLRLQGLREIAIDPPSFKLLYTLKGGRL